MKLNKLVLACTMALAANHAFALGPTVTPDVEVFISGSSAVQGALGAIASGMMTGVDTYYNTSNNGNDYRAYFGTVSGTGTALDGKKLLIHNRALGGSFQGVGPLARAQAVTRMAIDSSCVLSTSGSTAGNTCARTP